MHITSALTKYPHLQLASFHKPAKPDPAQVKPELSTAKGDPAAPLTPTKTKMAPSKPHPLTGFRPAGLLGKGKVPQGNDPAAFVKSKPAFTGRPVTLDHPAEVKKEPPSPLSRLDQLLEDWGQKGSPWDLNGDGTVGMMDLLTLLASMAPGSATDEAPSIGPNPSITSAPGPSPTFTPAPQVVPHPQDDQAPGQARIDALLEDWGQTDSPYDLNGDGIVDSADLTLLLGMIAGGSGQPDTPPEVNPELSVAPAQLDHPSPVQSRIDALLEDWGQSDSNYDLNGDGTVDSADLTLLLGMMAGGTQPAEEPQGDVGPTPPPAAALAAKLTSAIFASRDRDHNGLLTAKDLPGADPLFKRLDRDDDGGITKRELYGAITHSFKAALAGSEKPDLSRVVQRWLAAFGLNKHNSELEGPEKQSGHVTRPVRAAQHRAAAEHLARSLAPRLASSSLAEIRKVVDDSNVGQTQKKLILDRLTAWHPRGLTVSKVG